MKPFQDKAWKKFEREAKTQTARKMKDSAYVMAIAPDSAEAPDIKLAVEIGLCILMEKPLVVLAPEGRHVCEKLLRIADYVITGDVATEAGREVMLEKLRPILEQ